jgi:hypothetical protein
MTAGRVAQILNRGLRRTLGFQISRSRTDPHFHLYGRRARPVDPLYINVGAGYSRHPMWHALENPRDDYKKSVNADIAFDLTQDGRWPVESGSVELVYSSHTIEHLNDKFNAAWIAEAYRLEPVPEICTGR